MLNAVIVVTNVKVGGKKMEFLFLPFDENMTCPIRLGLEHCLHDCRLSYIKLLSKLSV